MSTRTDRAAFTDPDLRLDYGSITDDTPLLDYRVRANMHTFTKLNGVVNDCSRMNSRSTDRLGRRKKLRRRHACMIGILNADD